MNLKVKIAVTLNPYNHKRSADSKGLSLRQLHSNATQNTQQSYLCSAAGV